LAKSPKIAREEITISVDEFRVMALINSERTLPDLINVSPMGEFVTCRSIYRLIINNLIEVVGKREAKDEPKEDEEVVILSIIFNLYTNCFFRVRTLVDSILGEDNPRFGAFVAQYRTGIFSYFPGVDPKSDLVPSFEKFLAAVRAMPPQTRYHHLLTGLESMLTEQLEYVFQLLGIGVYREAVVRVKKEISEPLAVRRELVKRFGIDENFYKTVKRADRVVKMVRS
ncbi:MAG TPA: hypothetical protein VJ983_09955, partial [candidate division Zixibacteria bacterium]|nr:hypothetical protein [candidate division Zixibacteria bacterium]